MDALALLCTLHADGPATLRNLRQAGCGSIDAVERLEEERLSMLLGGPPAVARRFVREARHLQERLGQGGLDREETATDVAVPALEDRFGAVSPEFGALEPTSALEEAATEADAADEARDPIAEVLEAWCLQDRDELAQEEGFTPTVAEIHLRDVHDDEVPPRPVRARPEFEFGTAVANAMREITSAVADGESADPTSLDRFGPPAGSIDGLDEELSLAFGELGIESLAALAEADAFAISQAMGAGFTRIQRLVLLARRAVVVPREVRVLATVPEPFGHMPSAFVVSNETTSTTEEAGTAPVPAEKMSPSERPRRPSPSILELEWSLEGGTGPASEEVATDGRAALDDERESAGGPFA